MTATLPPGALARRTLAALATFTVNSTGQTMTATARAATGWNFTAK